VHFDESPFVRPMKVGMVYKTAHITHPCFSIKNLRTERRGNTPKTTIPKR
jgi:hypothetical protein